MIYGSVCSGIEAATAAWHPLGWKASFFSEIEKFPREVLGHHYPNVPLHGDFTTIKDKDYDPIELLVGGTPCQAFSVAGLRKGLSDSRGNLTLEFIRLAQRLKPKWLVWENVPGVLSIDKGRAFGSFLGGLAECGYGFAYRVLDAQYFGVPQRRRRVFVIGCFGDWRPAAQVLFEHQGLCGDITPCRETGQEVAGTFTSRAKSGGWGTDVDLASSGYMRPVANTLKGEGFDASEDGTGKQNLVVSTANCITTKEGMRLDPTLENLIPTLAGTMTKDVYSAGMGGRVDAAQQGYTVPTLTCNGDAHSGFRDENGLVPNGMRVRRLTPIECERLQGFPDNYTKIGDKTADSPRYKALGNSMAVPVMRWIGERIKLVEEK